MPKTAFISYCRKNYDFVDQARKKIHDAVGQGRCWMDLDKIESGEDFSLKIRSAIEESTIFLFFISEDSCSSKYALQELRFAKNVSSKKGVPRIVYVRVDDVPMQDGNPVGNLGTTDIVDWRDSRQQGKLIRDLKKWIGHAPCSKKRLVKALSKRGHWRKAKAFMEKEDILDAFEMANRVDEDHPMTQKVIKGLKKELGYSESAIDELLTEAKEPPKFTPLKIMEALKKHGLWDCAKIELKRRGLWDAFVTAREFDKDSVGYRPAVQWLRQRTSSATVKAILSDAEYKP